VEKEKGIIGQEITMYDDNPDWRLYFGLIQNLYQNHPVKIDIAGTIESIADIDKDWLYECYNTFYHPSNMLLFIVGPVDPDKIMTQVRDNQAKKDYKDMPEIKRKFEEEPPQAAEKKQVLQMNVQTSKTLLGIKALHVDQTGEMLLKNELTMNVLLDLLFGKSSENYNKLYDEGLVDETFSYDYTQEQGFGFAMVGGDTGEPDKLAERLKQVLLDAKQGSVFNEEQLGRAKKKKIGAFLRAVNSPEYIANQFTRYAFNDMNLFDVVPTLEKITLQDVQKLASEVISEERFSVCQVIPKQK
jgi:predicted Zn-dependent peptidase